MLQLLVHGHTYADVAQALGIAEGTVQTYVKRIYEKMDVSTKAEAALLAVARGSSVRSRLRPPAEAQLAQRVCPAVLAGYSRS